VTLTCLLSPAVSWMLEAGKPGASDCGLPEWLPGRGETVHLDTRCLWPLGWLLEQSLPWNAGQAWRTVGIPQSSDRPIQNLLKREVLAWGYSSGIELLPSEESSGLDPQHHKIKEEIPYSG
jgi:hypothetical protein